MPYVEIPVAGGSAEAYLALPDDRPEAAGRPADQVPGVVLFSDAIGLRPRIAQMADRIASWGYVVLAPNLFHQAGRAADIGPTEDLREPGARDRFGPAMMALIRGLSTPDSLSDTGDYLAALRRQNTVSDGPIGAVGYCLGARLATRAAGEYARDVTAVGGFHGGGLVTPAGDSPHLWIERSEAAYVYGHADQDRSMGPEAIATLGAALERAGRPATNTVYRGALHGYTMADTSVFDEDACERHFAELRSLFDRTLTSGEWSRPS
ncbi:MAG: dienelactone hydrolase family protein [Nostocoides sp.]